MLRRRAIEQYWLAPLQWGVVLPFLCAAGMILFGNPLVQGMGPGLAVLIFLVHRKQVSRQMAAA